MTLASRRLTSRTINRERGDMIARLREVAMTDRDMSPAYQVFDRRRAELIEREVARDNGVAEIRLVDFENLGVRPGTCGLARRQIALLGFVSVERGPPPRCTNTFRLAEGWQTIDAVECGRLRTQAHLPRPPKPKSVDKPRVMRRGVPSLPPT